MQSEETHIEKAIGAIVQGDKPAFEQLFRDWYVRLCIYAESIVRDRDIAEDLVQNMFCMLWERCETINVSESLKSYLYRSVHNSALNTLKHEKVKLAFFEFIRKYGVKDENNIEYYFDEESQKSLMVEINRAIESLPEQCREIFILSRMGGKRSMEIALMLDISVRTVETQLYRAMKRLREELSHLKNSEILFFIFFQKNCK